MSILERSVITGDKEQRSKIKLYKWQYLAQSLPNNVAFVQTVEIVQQMPYE